jgi:formylglycine-generating enzyme required for sulfatase activity
MLRPASLLFIILLSLFQAACMSAGPALKPDSTLSCFVPVPGGCFQMGNGYSDAYHIERPLHEVCLDDFAMARFAVTRGDFRKFTHETGYLSDAEKGDGCYSYDGSSWKKDPAASWRSPGLPQDDSHPVVCVSWNDAMAYAQWYSGKSGEDYRLPTEAQWEYAARSAGKIEKYAGGNDVDAVAWFAGNSGNGTHPVGQKQANGLGLYDMSGNVWQWTADWYGEKYYRESPRANPAGPATGSKRLFRGGSWFYDARGVRASYRDFAVPEFRSSYLGFRLIRQDKSKVKE